MPQGRRLTAKPLPLNKLSFKFRITQKYLMASFTRSMGNKGRWSYKTPQRGERFGLKSGVYFLLCAVQQRIGSKLNGQGMWHSSFGLHRAG